MKWYEEQSFVVYKVEIVEKDTEKKRKEKKVYTSERKCLTCSNTYYTKYNVFSWNKNINKKEDKKNKIKQLSLRLEL